MFIKLVRLGRDAELKQSGNTSFLTLSGVYDVGFGDKKQSQWINLVMFGQRAEKMAQYLTKGKQIVIQADDVRIEEYQGKSSLKATLIGFEFVAKDKTQEPHEYQQHSPQQQPSWPQPQNQASAPVYDFIDDLPF